MVIQSYKELILFIRTNKLNPKQASKLVTLALNVINLNEYENTESFIKDLDEFWEKWKGIKEKPIFIFKENQ